MGCPATHVSDYSQETRDYAAVDVKESEDNERTAETSPKED